MTPPDAPGRLERILAGRTAGDDSPAAEPTATLADRRRYHRRGRFRWRISLRALLTTALCLAVLVGAWWAVTSSAADPALTDPPLASHGPVAPVPSPRPKATQSPGAASSSIVVHVSGAVRHPGIVRLPSGARVYQAIDQAGGALDTAELDALNLAEPLQDGHKVHVPQRGEQEVTPAPRPADAAGGAGHPATGMAVPVRINSASEEQLMTLPRVGKVLADRIITWREQHGPFTRIEDLDAVDGIGPRLLEQLTPLIVLDGS